MEFEYDPAKSAKNLAKHMARREDRRTQEGTTASDRLKRRKAPAQARRPCAWHGSHLGGGRSFGVGMFRRSSAGGTSVCQAVSLALAVDAPMSAPTNRPSALSTVTVRSVPGQPAA